MSSSIKSVAPGGHATVRTYLAVSNVDRQVEFIHRVFQGAVKERLKNPEGHTVHGEIQIGDSIIMVGRATQEVRPIQGMCYVYVEQVDDIYNRALNNGATAISAPVDQIYGNREGGFKDMEGNTWWVSQFIKELPVEEMEKEIAKMSTR